MANNQQTIKVQNHEMELSNHSIQNQPLPYGISSHSIPNPVMSSPVVDISNVPFPPKETINYVPKPTRTKNSNEVIKCKSCTLYPPINSDVIPLGSRKPPFCRGIWVGGLPKNCTETILTEVFERFGEFQDIRKMNLHFGHIKYKDKDSVKGALTFSGYRLVIGDSDHPDNTGLMFVDYLKCREDDAADWEKQKNLLEESPPTIPSCTEDKLKNDKQINTLELLATLLDRSEYKEQYSSNLFNLVLIASSHVKRLHKEKQDQNSKMKKVKSESTHKMKEISKQMKQIEKFYGAVSQQKVWEYFTEPQRKNIENCRTELSETIFECDENMDISDEEPTSKKLKPQPNSSDANGKLEREIEAYKNEIAVLKSDYQKDLTEANRQVEILTETLTTTENDLVKAVEEQNSSRVAIEELQAFKNKVEEGEISEDDSTKWLENLQSRLESERTKRDGEIEILKNINKNLQNMNTVVREMKHDITNLQSKDHTDLDEKEELQREISSLKDKLEKERSSFNDTIEHLEQNLVGTLRLSTFISADEARLIGLISTFLLPYVMGVTISDIWSYVKSFGTTLAETELEDKMNRWCSAFKKNDEGNWTLNIYNGAGNTPEPSPIEKECITTNSSSPQNLTESILYREIKVFFKKLKSQNSNPKTDNCNKTYFDSKIMKRNDKSTKQTEDQRHLEKSTTSIAQGKMRHRIDDISQPSTSAAQAKVRDRINDERQPNTSAMQAKMRDRIDDISQPSTSAAQAIVRDRIDDISQPSTSAAQARMRRPNDDSHKPDYLKSHPKKRKKYDRDEYWKEQNKISTCDRQKSPVSEPVVVEKVNYDANVTNETIKNDSAKKNNHNTPIKRSHSKRSSLESCNCPSHNCNPSKQLKKRDNSLSGKNRKKQTSNSPVKDVFSIKRTPSNDRRPQHSNVCDRREESERGSISVEIGRGDERNRQVSISASRNTNAPQMCLNRSDNSNNKPQTSNILDKKTCGVVQNEIKHNNVKNEGNNQNIPRIDKIIFRRTSDNETSEQWTTVSNKNNGNANYKSKLVITIDNNQTSTYGNINNNAQMQVPLVQNAPNTDTSLLMSISTPESERECWEAANLNGNSRNLKEIRKYYDEFTRKHNNIDKNRVSESSLSLLKHIHIEVTKIRYKVSVLKHRSACDKQLSGIISDEYFQIFEQFFDKFAPLEVQPAKEDYSRVYFWSQMMARTLSNINVINGKIQTLNKSGEQIIKDCSRFFSSMTAYFYNFYNFLCKCERRSTMRITNPENADRSSLMLPSIYTYSAQRDFKNAESNFDSIELTGSLVEMRNLYKSFKEKCQSCRLELSSDMSVTMRKIKAGVQRLRIYISQLRSFLSEMDTTGMVGVQWCFSNLSDEFFQIIIKFVRDCLNSPDINDTVLDFKPPPTIDLCFSGNFHLLSNLRDNLFSRSISDEYTFAELKLFYRCIEKYVSNLIDSLQQFHSYKDAGVRKVPIEVVEKYLSNDEQDELEVISAGVEDPSTNARFAEENLADFEKTLNLRTSNLPKETEFNPEQMAVMTNSELTITQIHVFVIRLRKMFESLRDNPEYAQLFCALSESYYRIFYRFLRFLPIFPLSDVQKNHHKAVGQFIPEFHFNVIFKKLNKRLPKLRIQFDLLKDMTVVDRKVFADFNPFFDATFQYIYNLYYVLRQFKTIFEKNAKQGKTLPRNLKGTIHGSSNNISDATVTARTVDSDKISKNNTDKSISLYTILTNIKATLNNYKTDLIEEDKAAANNAETINRIEDVPTNTEETSTSMLDAIKHFSSANAEEETANNTTETNTEEAITEHTLNCNKTDLANVAEEKTGKNNAEEAINSIETVPANIEEITNGNESFDGNTIVTEVVANSDRSEAVNVSSDLKRDNSEPNNGNDTTPGGNVIISAKSVETNDKGQTLSVNSEKAGTSSDTAERKTETLNNEFIFRRPQPPGKSQVYDFYDKRKKATIKIGCLDMPMSPRSNTIEEYAKMTQNLCSELHDLFEKNSSNYDRNLEK